MLMLGVVPPAWVLWRHLNPALLVLAGGVTYMLLPHVVHLFPH